MKKLAVLGNGRVAQHYERILSTYFTDSEYAVTDVIDNNPDKLANIVYPQCSKHTSLSKFLNSKSGKLVHYVLVCTPSFLHFEHTKQLLEANIIPIVEKPPVLRVSEIEKLEEIEKKTGLKAIYIFQNRFNPTVQYVKDLIKQNMLGSIVSAAVVLRWCRENSYYEDEWHGRWALDGGVSAQQGIHHLDALQYLAGDLKSVACKRANIINKMEAEDTLVGIGELLCGGLATIELTVAARPEDFEASISLTGSKGFVKIGGIALNKLETLMLSDNGKLKNFDTEAYDDEITQGYGISHHRQLQEIFDDSLPNRFSLEDVQNTVILLHSLHVAAETGRHVSLSEKKESKMLGAKHG